jgi:signal transduction histidine kinase
VGGKGMRIGLALAVALLSLALADRINRLKHEKAEAQAENLKTAQDHERVIREQNMVLEQNVAERTAELEQSHAELAQSHDELERRNTQLHALNASKDKFFTIIAQDLQQPILELLELTDFIPEHIEEFTAEEVKEIAAKLRVSIETLHELLKNLFTWSGIQRGSIVPRIENVDLKNLIQQHLRIFIPIAEHKQILLRNHVPEGTCVNADPDMLYAVLRNLISNALKFSFPGDNVMITVQNEAVNSHEWTRIAVADTGVGMSPENVSKLFREDVSFQTPGTDGEEGTGLGLILCKKIVEQHGGKIWIESDETNGTTVYFTLPARL